LSVGVHHHGLAEAGLEFGDAAKQPVAFGLKVLDLWPGGRALPIRQGGVRLAVERLPADVAPTRQLGDGPVRAEKDGRGTAEPTQTR
jgi:hypothetical protein